MNTTILKEVMRQKKISQNKLSQMAAIPASNMSLFINGKSPIFPAWRKRIARALEVPEEVLFPEFEVK